MDISPTRASVGASWAHVNAVPHYCRDHNESYPHSRPSVSNKIVPAKSTATPVDLAVRVAAAKAALPCERSPLAAVQPPRGDRDFVPLAERLKQSTRQDTIAGSQGKVMEMRRMRLVRSRYLLDERSRQYDHRSWGILHLYDAY
jgi:hypothetical protein